MRDRTHRADGFASIAPDADLWINQVLFDDDGGGHVHGVVSWVLDVLSASGGSRPPDYFSTTADQLNRT